MGKEEELLPQETFDRLVLEALASLPPFFQQKMDNVEVLVEVWPQRYHLQQAGMTRGSLLLGLYEGIPLTSRTSSYNLVPPDTITLFQGPIESRAGRNFEQIREQVRRTVIHEIAHHFGIDDDRLHELGAY